MPTGSTLRQDISVATMLRHLLLLLQIDLVVTRSGNLCSERLGHAAGVVLNGLPVSGTVVVVS